MRVGPSTGLAGVEIRAATDAALNALAQRVEAAGFAATRRGRSLSISDPWGAPLTVVGANP